MEGTRVALTTAITASRQEELKQKKREHAKSSDEDPEHRRVCVTNTESGMTLAGEDAPLASELQASTYTRHG